MSNSEKCPICSNPELKSLGEKNSFKIVKCRNCITVFSNPKNDLQPDLYDYDNYYRGKNLKTPDFVYETYREVVRGVESYRANNRFLDVGCGAGALLEVATGLGWETQGVEISKTAVEFMRNRGLKVFEGSLEEAGFPDGHFDVITCTEVIEHVTDPKSLINQMSRILSPKGVLWITTPHSCGLSGKLLGTKWNNVYPPEHLTLFSIKSLKLCLENAGFKKFRFVSSGINPFDFYRDLTSPVSTPLRDSNVAGEDIKSNGNGAGTDDFKKDSKLNNWLVGGKGRKMVKGAVNSFLNSTKLGDTIKVWATFE